MRCSNPSLLLLTLFLIAGGMSAGAETNSVQLPIPLELQELHDLRVEESSRQLLVLAHLDPDLVERASLVILNRFSRDLSVDIVVLDSAGAEAIVGTYLVLSRSALELQLSEILGEVAKSRGGALRLEYLGDEEMLQGWVVFRVGNDVAELSLVNPKLASVGDLVSFWEGADQQWGRDAEPFFSLHNTSSAATTVAVSSRAAKEKWRDRSFTIGANKTVIIRPQGGARELQAGWLRVRADPKESEALVIGGMMKSRDGLRALPTFPVGALVDSSRLESFPVPSQSLDEIVSAAESKPIVLSVADARLQGDDQLVDVLMVCEGRSSPQSQERLVTSPGEIAAIELFAPPSTEPTEGSSCRVMVVASEGGLLARLSMVTAARELVEIPMVRSDKGHSSGQYPLFPVRDFDVRATFLNVGSHSVTIFGHVAYPGEDYALAPFEIPPGSAYTLDLNALQASGVEDLVGRRYPSSDTRGFFQWTARGAPGTVLARTSVALPGRKDSFGFNCSGCCEEFPTGGVVPNSVAFDIGQTASFEAVQWISTCAGTMGPYYAYPSSVSYSSPLTWDSHSLAADDFTNQTLSFQASDEYLWINCQVVTRNFGGSGGATVDRCSAQHNPGHDPEQSCFQQQASCSSCYSCCEKQKQVGYCRCSGSEPCRQLARAQCGTCKQACFGHFNASCSTQETSCNT